MITSLSISTDSSRTLSILSDTLLLQPTDNGILIGISNLNMLLLDPYELSSYIESINGVEPLDDGSIHILGSLCVSLYSNGDPIEEDVIYEDDYRVPGTLTELQELNIKNTSILMYDGCAACLNCQDIWKLYEQLLLAHLWAVAMKDCILYALLVDNEGKKQLVAGELWKKSLLKEINDFLGSEGTYGETIRESQNDKGCLYTYSVLDPLYRLNLFNKAKRLLQEYKATVAIWNYLCFLNTTTTQILEASLDWSGFIVQTKKKINNCNTLGPIELTSLFILLLLIKGQLATYLRSLPLLKTAPRRMLLLIVPVALNTYILVGTDTGNIDQHSQIVLNIDNETGAVLQMELNSIVFSKDIFMLQGASIFCNVLEEENTSVTDPQPSSVELQYKVRCLFLFKNLPQLQLILSASVKILPVIVYSSGYLGSTLLNDVTQYVAYRVKSTDVHSSLHAKVNLWKISLGWQDTLNGLNSVQECVELTLTRYYTTGFCKYPSKLHLDLEETLENL